MDKVFITGGNGFVGLNIVSQLIEKGFKVHAYVRSNSNTSYLEQMSVKIFRGDLSDERCLDDAMAGCRYVIHTAGNTSCYQKDMLHLIEANVDGTQCVINAAKKAKIERIVFTSTTSTIGCIPNSEFSSDEKQPITGFRKKSPYSITKRKAEELVLLSQDDNLEVIILNLAEVVGAYDHNLQWGRMILAVNYNQVPFIPPGGGSFCSSRSAAIAHISALSNGKSGERYIIAGADHEYKEFIRLIAKKLDAEFTIPTDNYEKLKLKARLYEKLPFLFKEKPIVDPYRMRVFADQYYFNSAKAQQELYYEPDTLDIMLEDAIDWYQKNGYLK